MSRYPFTEIEKKWQQYWENNGSFVSHEDPAYPREKRRYVLDMFPYPSGKGLHVGHPLAYIATDIYCRYLRMNGYNVLHPTGFDAFGLPAENFAIQTGAQPAETTARNSDRFRKQIKSLGFSYDWTREISTCTPDYYRWTQWIFLKLFEHGLAYEADMPINWCPSCKTGLANEEVKDGHCDRCGTLVIRRRIRQWVLRITEYAERLLADLELLDWPEPIKIMQRNWIGRSEGATVYFGLENTSEKLEIFTTRQDTIFGATFIVVAPEHPLLPKITSSEHKKAVDAYIQKAATKSDLERTDLAKEKTGTFTGGYAINPLNGQRVPIWVSDYVLVSYGTGAIMAVPAHDERDWEFAKQYGLPIVTVVAQAGTKEAEGGAVAEPEKCVALEGVAVNSGSFNGLSTKQFKEDLIEWLEKKGLGKRTVHFKLRDWIYSRQRYWGEPIPLVHCQNCGIVPLPESELPLVLPHTSVFLPTDTGESPLAKITDWVNTSCPKCKGPAKRETNTMPQWAGSCWYYLRFLDPKNSNCFASIESQKYWMPVDLYIGGAEHAVLHLLYSRFWHKFLYDIGVVTTPEPFIRLFNQGMILGADNQKMSKSKGNIVNPEDIIAEYGADSMRVYEMFMGPLDVSKHWATSGLVGVSRFLEKVWAIGTVKVRNCVIREDTEKLMHRTIKKVSADTVSLDFNTAIAAMMIMVNHLAALKEVDTSVWDIFVKLLSPYAPHLAEELWSINGHSASIAYESWPQWEEKFCLDDEVEIVVQINGKLRCNFTMQRGADNEAVKEKAFAQPKVQDLLGDRKVVRIICVPDKLINIVVQ